jgi:signal transduction histidine kinase
MVNCLSEDCAKPSLTRGCISLFFYVLSIGVQAANAEDLYVSNPGDQLQAGFVLIDSDKPPESAMWEPIQLPHLWSRKNIDGRIGWYRFPLPTTLFEKPHGVYLWRFSMNTAVWLNDEFLGDGGRFTEPMARNWNRPFLYLLPKSAWRPTENYLYIKLGAYPSWGNLAPIVIGPYSELRQDYDQRFFLQVTLSQATLYISLITAIVAFALWAADRKSSMYAMFGLSCLAWSFYSLNLYLQNIPLSAKLWWSFVHSSVDWYGVTLALFAHRLMDMSVPIRERLLVMFATLATISYFVADLTQLARINNYFHAISLCIVFYLFFLGLWRIYQKRAFHIVVFTTCIAVIALFGLHDLSMNTMLIATMWQNQFFWLQFSAPILMIAMLLILAHRFALSFRDQINVVEQIRIEREKIYSDIHDDVGSKVLSLVYSAENDEQAEYAREALRDIRAIVAGGTHSGGNLQDLIDICQAETRERFTLRQIEIHWKVSLDDPNREIRDSLQYQLQRIIRELTTNIIKHAGTQQVDVSLISDSENLNLLIRDFGIGLSSKEQGTGMAGISRRVLELGGIVDWKSSQPGCEVEVRLPFEFGG